MDKQGLAEVADRVEAFLSGFDTPEAFLAACEARGIEAMPYDSCNCALAKLIEDQFPELQGVATVVVQPHRLLIAGAEGEYGEVTLRIVTMSSVACEKRRMTDPAVAFAVGFDEEEYTSIIAEEWYETDEETE